MTSCRLAKRIAVKKIAANADLNGKHKNSTDPARRPAQVPNFVVTVYVCPECGNYYGSSSVSEGDMMKPQLNFHTRQVLPPRINCPSCRVLRGKEVIRTLCRFEI